MCQPRYNFPGIQDEYHNNEALRDRAERNLHVAAQACIDIANHIIADRGYRTPQGYADSFATIKLSIQV